MSIQDIAKATDAALQALEELEQAIDAGNNVKIGAALYELRRALKEADREVDKANSR